LIRPEDNRIIAGVCSGLGNFFSVDPTVIRIIFILITVFGGSGVLLYFILWLIMPAEKSAYAGSAIRENAGEIKEETKNLVQKGKNYAQKEITAAFWDWFWPGWGFCFYWKLRYFSNGAPFQTLAGNFNHYCFGDSL